MTYHCSKVMSHRQHPKAIYARTSISGMFGFDLRGNWRGLSRRDVQIGDEERKRSEVADTRRQTPVSPERQARASPGSLAGG